MSGSIRNKGKNTWQITVELGGRNRQRKYKTIHGSRKDAEKILRDMLYELEHGTLLDVNTLRMDDWMQEWYDSCEAKGLSKTTLVNYLRQTNDYIIPEFGEYRVQNISTLQIQKWIDELSKCSPFHPDKGLSPKTIRNIFLNLKLALDKAVKSGIITKNPCDDVDLPKRKKTKPKIYTTEQVHELLEAVRDTDLDLPVNIMVALGVRRGELLALRWEHIDLDERIAHICENLVKVDSEALLKEPKSESSNRKITIPLYLVQMLRTEYERQRKIFSEEDLLLLPVVCLENGEYYMPDSFSRKFTRFLEDNGLEHIRVHDLRHISATILLKQNVSPKVVQERLGHADVSTTLNIYSHVPKEVEEEAADKLNEVLGA